MVGRSDAGSPELGARRRIHRHVRDQVPLQVLAAGDGDPTRPKRTGTRRISADATWTLLVGTPPIPDYDSGHAVEGGAAAQVLKRVFGDHVTLKVCSLTLLAGANCIEGSQVLRTYHRFTQAADENGLSRILVGFHPARR